jgi:hypothetical protein
MAKIGLKRRVCQDVSKKSMIGDRNATGAAMVTCGYAVFTVPWQTIFRLNRKLKSLEGKRWDHRGTKSAQNPIIPEVIYQYRTIQIG